MCSMPNRQKKITCWAWPCAVALSGIFVIGCGSGSAELPVAKVRGKVTFQNQPLQHGEVTLAPQRGRAARGAIEQDGTFELSTYEQGDGAVVGKHVVTVTCVRMVESRGTGSPDDAAFRKTGQSLIPRDYGEAGRSGLEFEVKAGEENYLELNL